MNNMRAILCLTIVLSAICVGALEKVIVNGSEIGVPDAPQQVQSHKKQDEKGVIVGGVIADIEDVPYQLQMESFLSSQEWRVHCGAVIIGTDSVLTAAHCIPQEYNPSKIRFRAGSSEKGRGTIHNAVSVVVHPNYETSAPDYDIAYLKVLPPFSFNAKTKPIQRADAEPNPGDIGTVSGWGYKEMYMDTNHLLKVDVPVIDKGACNMTEPYIGRIFDRQICAAVPEGGKDACDGDSGGPFVVNGKLAGLVSRGIGCGIPGNPGVYTNVAAFSKWIQLHQSIAEFCDESCIKI